jgi:hypothetical protein
MGRIRLGGLAGIALVLVAAGTVFATRQPQEPSPVAGVADEEEGAPPSAEDLAHAADRLRANEIAVDEAQLGELAAAYGVGGAVRILAWSADPDDDVTVDSIRLMRDGDGTEGSAMGWGRIARELGVHPGLGSIMGNGGGHGRDSAPGQGRDDDAGD